MKFGAAALLIAAACGAFVLLQSLRIEMAIDRVDSPLSVFRTGRRVIVTGIVTGIAALVDFSALIAAMAAMVALLFGASAAPYGANAMRWPMAAFGLVLVIAAPLLVYKSGPEKLSNLFEKPGWFVLMILLFTLEALRRTSVAMVGHWPKMILLGTVYGGALAVPIALASPAEMAGSFISGCMLLGAPLGLLLGLGVGAGCKGEPIDFLRRPDLSPGPVVQFEGEDYQLVRRRGRDLLKLDDGRILILGRDGDLKVFPDLLSVEDYVGIKF